MNRLPWKTLFLCLLSAAVFGCDAADDHGTDGIDAGAPKDTSQSHDGGLADPECWSCHDRATVHHPEMLPHQCAACHGDDGPLRPLDHIDTRCTTCHGTPHEPAKDFPSPDSCMVCHAGSEF